MVYKQVIALPRVILIWFIVGLTQLEFKPTTSCRVMQLAYLEIQLSCPLKLPVTMCTKVQCNTSRSSTMVIDIRTHIQQEEYWTQSTLETRFLSTEGGSPLVWSTPVGLQPFPVHLPQTFIPVDTDNIQESCLVCTWGTCSERQKVLWCRDQDPVQAMHSMVVQPTLCMYM